MIVTFIKRGNDNDTWGQRWRSTMKVWSPSPRSHSANYWHRILEDILSEKILSAFHFFITSFLLPSRRRFLLRSSQSFIKYILQLSCVNIAKVVLSTQLYSVEVAHKGEMVKKVSDIGSERDFLTSERKKWANK